MTPWVRMVLSRGLSVWLIATFAAVWGVAISKIVATHGDVGFDFHVFYTAARAIGSGDVGAIYDPRGLAAAHALAAQNLAVPVPSVSWAVYPPVVYEVLVPLGYLPWAIADAIGVTLLALPPFLALRVMGVRDWRCYVVVYASVPLYTSIVHGTISGALMLAVALMWRGRGLVLAGGAAVAAKLFLWPLLLVELARDRRRGMLLIVAAAALVIVPWALIGFSDITRYPAMLSDLSASEGHDSFSTVGLAYALRLPLSIGTYAGIALGVIVTALAVRAERAGRHDAAYTLAIGAALLASPIVWMHYMMLFYLPLASRHPRFNWIWALAVVPWLRYPWGADGHISAFLITWPCYGIIVIAAAWPQVGEGVVRRMQRVISPRIPPHGRLADRAS